MSEVNFQRARFNMVEQQVRTWEVLDDRVLDVLGQMPREDFVPEGRRNLAFADLFLPIGYGEVMLSPKMEARMLQALAPTADETALEIGSGTGYLSACLSRLAGEVVSVERRQEFHDLAARQLDAASVHNVRLEVGDAAIGWKDGRQYDAIAVTGSLPQFHNGFHRSLTVGGRLFLIVGEPPIMEALLITRVAEDQWASESLFDTSVPPLVGAPRKARFEL